MATLYEWATNPRRGRHGARVNIVDVAERAGVSPATVSRSLRGLAKVAPETRQRVLDAARELSYVTSLRASGPAAGSRRSVAVIVPFITRWFFSTVTAGAVDFLRIRGYDVVLYHLGSADIRDHFFERMPLDPGWKASSHSPCRSPRSTPWRSARSISPW